MPKAKNQSPEPSQPEPIQPVVAQPQSAPAAPQDSSMPLVVLLISTIGFVSFAGPLASIVALVIGYDTRKKMRAGAISKKGVDMLKIGMVLAYVGIGVLAVGIAIFAPLMVFYMNR